MTSETISSVLTSSTVGRITSYLSVLRKTAQIITGNTRLDVQLKHLGSGMAAATDGKTIWYDTSHASDWIDKLPLPRFIVVLKGVSYHEQAHILFTPLTKKFFADLKEAVTIVPGLRDQDVRVAWNVLEDNRIERLFIGAFPPAERYLRAVFADALADNANFISTMYPLVSGRFWLGDLRAEMRAHYVNRQGETLAAKIDAIVAEYQRLLAPRDVKRMIELSVKLAKLFKSEDLTSDVQAASEAVLGSHDQQPDTMQNVRTMPVSDQEMADETADSMEDGSYYSDEEDDESDDAEQGDGGSTGSKDEGGEEGSDAESTDGQGGNGAQPGEGDGNGQSMSDDQSSNEGQGGGAGDGPRGDIHDISKMAQAMRNEEVEELMDEIQQIIEQAVREVCKPSEVINVDDYKIKRNFGVEHPVWEDDRVDVRKTQRLLTKLFGEITPHYERGESHGKLNIRRAIRQEVRDSSDVNIFDLWDEGMEEEAGLELVVALDISGSMAPHELALGRVVWRSKQLDRFLPTIDVTVLAYESDMAVLHRPGGPRPTSRFQEVGTRGGTNPDTCFSAAARIFASSERKNQCLIVFTDGQWAGDAHYQQRLLRSMRSSGVAMIGAGLTASNAQNLSGKGVFDHVVNCQQSPTVTADIMSGVVRGVAQRARLVAATRR